MVLRWGSPASMPPGLMVRGKGAARVSWGLGSVKETT